MSGLSVAPSKSLLDRLVDIWAKILPHRHLHTNELKVSVSHHDKADTYNGANLSDGERVAFYLVGQAICAKPGSIIIIDEPEIHLHKSIQESLWDAIEAERQDCTFVYITHDLDFASRRVGATRIWLKSYTEPEHWDYTVLREPAGMPEALYLELLGSRQPILFVEGTAGGIDDALFRLCYDGCRIIPVGSCEQVIMATKAFRAQAGLHHLQVFGLIDHDRRDTAEAESLKQVGIHTLPVAEVENIFLLEDVLRAVAMQMCVSNADLAIENVKAFVLQEFGKSIKQHCLSVVAHRIERSLGGLDLNRASVGEFQELIARLPTDMNVQAVYDETEAQARSLIEKKDYGKVLSVFNHKGVVAQVGRFVDVKPGGLVQKVKEIIKAGNVDPLAAIRKAMPRIEVAATL